MAPLPCVVAFCTKVGTLTFPKAETRRAEWIQAIEHVKPGLTIKKHSRICSDHFKASDFNATTLSQLQPDLSRKSLKKTAAPSIFPWKAHLHNSPSTSQDQNLFIRTNVVKTYARVPPVLFVEEQLYMDVPEKELTDPLKLSDEHFENYPENEVENAEENNDNHLEYENTNVIRRIGNSCKR